MARRTIVRIDEALCDGCGLCVPACAEGALEIVDGKARLVEDRYCDGLGACLGNCPRGAITLEEREAEDFDEEAVERRLAGLEEGCFTCPGTAAPPGKRDGRRQWPVQLRLVSPQAPFLAGADLLLAADCVPFALPDFHSRLLRDRAVVVGCPKLDDPGEMVGRLAAIVRQASPTRLTVAHMEVPCCFALAKLAQEALRRAGRHLPVETVTVSTQGDLLDGEP